MALGGRGLVLKYGAVGAVLLFLFLLILGAGAGNPAFADACGDRGTPGQDTGGDSGADEDYAGIRDRQIKNAKIIDSVAEDVRLSGRATLIALMTALQESTLLNIDYGDRDSIGLFQQRPSQGWGTREQILDPEYSSRMFFLGGDGGDPPGLTDISGWQRMELGDAAQAVQRSAYPDLYAGQESAAREIADEAGIDLNRSGRGTGPAPDPERGGGEDGPESCYPESPGGGGDPEDPFHDGEADWPAAVKNPRSTADAIAWARREAKQGGRDWYRMCLAFTARAYGWSYSGVHYAIDHYKDMPAEMKHDQDREPPPGALMYWDTGQRAGHVALYVGDGKIASNDIERPGYIDIAPATAPETKWGATYLGWAPPYFPQGG